jgi:hypothetical protein
MKNAKVISIFVEDLDFGVKVIPGEQSLFVLGSPYLVAVLVPQIIHAIKIAWTRTSLYHFIHPLLDSLLLLYYRILQVTFLPA